MNFMQKLTPGTSRDRSHQIITGKRTEHQRPSSPFSMVQTTSSSDTGGCMLSSYSSPTLSSDEEEEDMANCLILLAQSVSPDKSDLHRQKTEKLNNRKLTESITTTAGGKTDFNNYECKTCNRAFPSFQALGGHRASHKKPKITIEDRKSDSVKIEDIVEFQVNKIVTNNNKSPSPPPEFIQTVQKNSKAKVHECSICGSEFLSGQALGGHMRRHRPPPPSNTQIAVSSSITNDTKPNHSPKKSPLLTLDLNLPAPEVVDDVHSSFQCTASSSQQPLVFSPVALVDCHY